MDVYIYIYICMCTYQFSDSVLTVYISFLLYAVLHTQFLLESSHDLGLQTKDMDEEIWCIIMDANYAMVKLFAHFGDGSGPYLEGRGV